MTPQEKRVSDWLNQFGSIEPLQAMMTDGVGVYRLSAVIHRLRHIHNMKIKTNIVPVKNRFNETCHIARYILEKWKDFIWI